MLIIEDYRSTSSTFQHQINKHAFHRQAFGVDHACDQGPQIALKLIMLVINPAWDFITETSAAYQHQINNHAFHKQAFGVDHACDRGPQIALKSIMLVIDATWDFKLL
ncbi:hypothetical protein TIFTF001_007087 [Ficus carica]|uniref:Uncharacterized protein n=1 Tax=Ficus carica TaxID=3494 RepID=A0AA87ZQD4_FICCA|nr:hypothetical protein TIFTF001_007087 [Ficus carica]